MKITELSVNKHVAIYILIFIIFSMGWVTYTSLPREAAPDITIPIVYIAVPYPGVSPTDIEALVTQPIEKELQAVNDVKEIRSTSSEGVASIQVEFEPEVDIDYALQKVREKVDLAKPEMPSDIEEPIIAEFNFSEQPIMIVNVAGSGGLVQLKEIAEDLEDKIEQIPGILNVDVAGGLVREVKVNVDPERLQYYNLSLNDVVHTIQDENITIPGGTVDIGTYTYLVRIPGEFEVTDIIEDLVLSAKDNHPIYIRDVASVEYAFKDRETYARQNEVECVSISISKRSGENLLIISDKIKDLLKKESKRFPAGVSYTVTNDASKFVRNMVDELDNNIITGLLLVFIVLFFFLNTRISLIVATAIPLSMLITFLVVQSIGWTLNFVVLFALILALGMLVDDAIVVCENIFRFREEGYSLKDAALLGTKEVAVPVITSTATIIAAFLPMAFWPGIVGEFMKYLPITVIIALCASMFVALAINPTLSSRFLHIRGGRVRKSYREMAPEEMPSIIRVYRRLLIYTLQHPVLTLLTTFVVLIGVVLLFGKFNAGVEFFPKTEPSTVFIGVEAPVGTNVETTDTLIQQIEQKMEGLPDMDIMIARIGVSMSMEGSSSSANKGTVSIDFIDREDRSQSSFKTVDEIRERLTDIAGAIIEIQQNESGPPTGPPINIEISGDDFEVLGDISETIRRKIRDIPGVVDLKDDYIAGRPEIRVEIDREKAALYGLSTRQIAGTIRTAINGVEASKYRVGEDEYDITVRLIEERRNTIDAIREITIASEGKQIPLSAIASIKTGGGLGSIKRTDLKRTVTISGDVQGRNPNEVLHEVMAATGEVDIPLGYTIRFTGENEEQAETADFLSKAFFATILLIVFVLVAEFNSLKVPILVMSGVVLSIIGVLIGLMITRTPFGIVMTGIGIISLAGVVVRNGIVLLDYVLILREKGVSQFDSLVIGGITRLRPVFLTAITTIIGLIPTALGISVNFKQLGSMIRGEGGRFFVIGGESAQWWAGLAISVIFGLAFATILTLVVLPVMYYTWERAEAKVAAIWHRFFPKSKEEDSPTVETAGA
ncbi:MAG: efflux RND transporter permease subunit [Gemmatimonadetes bacterium]|nr:MAG: efflux RND transporter permease subunit [Gemmatimonadota bacterium]